MTEEILIIDCAYPPAVYPTAWQGKKISGCMVYVGGDTPHVWTPAEIAHMMAQPGYTYCVPVFTRDNPQGVGQAGVDGVTAANWSLTHKQPKNTYFMVDAEAAVDSEYFQTFDTMIKSRAGLLEILYGQKSTVVKNVRPSGGYDEADWNFSDTVPTGADAAQFADYPLYDVNRFANPNLLWNFRAQVAVSPPVSTPTALQEDQMEIVNAPRSAAADADRDMFLLGNGGYNHLTPKLYATVKGWGLPVRTVDYQDHSALLAMFKGTPAS